MTTCQTRRRQLNSALRRRFVHPLSAPRDKAISDLVKYLSCCYHETNLRCALLRCSVGVGCLPSINGWSRLFLRKCILGLCVMIIRRARCAESRNLGPFDSLLLALPVAVGRKNWPQKLRLSLRVGIYRGSDCRIPTAKQDESHDVTYILFSLSQPNTQVAGISQPSELIESNKPR